MGTPLELLLLLLSRPTPSLMQTKKKNRNPTELKKSQTLNLRNNLRNHRRKKEKEEEKEEPADSEPGHDIEQSVHPDEPVTAVQEQDEKDKAEEEDLEEEEKPEIAEEEPETKE